MALFTTENSLTNRKDAKDKEASATGSSALRMARDTEKPQIVHRYW